jgi:anhydro-N-acetylmuramic acid kinase
MVYRAIGVLYSYSSLVVSFSEFHENAGKWSFELKKHKAYPKERWRELIQRFIEENNLQYQVALITVHAEVAEPQISGPSIAAITGLPVITNLSDVDREFGGNGEFYKSCAQKLGMDNSSADDVNKSVYIAFMGILRWREEYNFLSSDTGAKRSSIGGAVWTGQEA